ncbi:MAG: hypothetical protein K0R90_799, partial [Oscillospiraceae bacterium]|nr:hypothetical protein [Oscillospiraceae bacterium]
MLTLSVEVTRMKLRPPAVPLITVDPYFSVWSMADKLTDDVTKHWTGKPNTMVGTAEIDGVSYCFMGDAKQEDLPALKQTDLSVNALSTTYTFEGAGVVLTARFTTPVLPQDLYLFSRPITYLKLTAKSLDGKKHSVKASIKVSEEICLDLKGQMEVVTDTVDVASGIKTVKMGSVGQPVLEKAGDDLRIDWGYFYLSVKAADSNVSVIKKADDDSMNFVCADASFDTDSETSSLFAFAYDDIDSMVYFGEKLKAYWRKDGETIEQAIAKAFGEYDVLVAKCDTFSDDLYLKATVSGGEQYAQLLELSYRQVVAAHKLILDTNGDALYISKECFSNGCAATVDVSYPSIPMFLYYNPELVKAMA